MESLPTTARADSPEANNSVKSEDGNPQHDPGRGSPPPNCAICLGTCRNKSFTDSCLHQFCFKCLLTWSKVKAECPLCKQIFRSIIHNVRSNNQYEEYMVGQRTTEELSERIDIDNLTSTRRYRYRTTLTLPRQESLAIQQLLLQHYPIVAELFPSAIAPRRRSPASFRRTVYRYSLWARPLPDFTRRFRACTPEFYRQNPSQMQRLVPWLNRELLYLLNENVGHIEYVVTKILELLPQYHINTIELRNALQRYLREHTDHFLHELYCFASTPYDLSGYDRHVQYTTDSSISTMINEVVSSADSDASTTSDIVMISASELTDPPPSTSREAMEDPHYRQRCIMVNPSRRVIPIETISHSDTDDDSSEVMVVGYIKPPEDRTPEVVDLLGSDSDVVVELGSGTAMPSLNLNLPESTSTSRVQITLQTNNNSVASGRRTSPPRTGPARSPVHIPGRRRTRYFTNTDGSSRTTPSPPPLPTPPAPYVRGSSLYLSPCSSPSTIDSFSYGCESTSDSLEGTKPPRFPERYSYRRQLPDAVRRRRRKKKRAYRQRRHELQAAREKEEQSKNKSYYGVGVKSSKSSTSGESGSATAGPQRAQPESTQQQPTTSGLAQQQRVQTDRAQCQSSQQQRTQPEQAQQQRVQPGRAQSEQEQQRTQPVRAQPEQAQQQRVQPGSSQSECTQQQRVQPGSSQSECTQQQRVQPGSSQSECTQQQRVQPGSSQSECTQQQRVQPGSSQSECTQQQRVQPGSSQSECTQQQRVQPGSSQSECTQQQRVQPGSAQSEYLQQQRMQPVVRLQPVRPQPPRALPVHSQHRTQPERSHAERTQLDRAQSGRTQQQRAQLEREPPERAQPQRAQLERAPPERVQSEPSQPERAQKKRTQPERAQQRLQPERTQPQRARSERTRSERSQPERTQPSRSQPSRSQREEPERALDVPSTNEKPRGRKRLRRPESARRYQLSRESKRLKSVVKVINGQSHSVHTIDYSDTDSDDLPLNLTVMKGRRK